MKKCNKCKEIFPLSEANFNRNKNSLDGFRHYCKVCEREASKRYYEKNKEEQRKKKNDYYHSLPLEVKRKIQSDRYLSTPIEERRAEARKHYLKNSESILERKRKWRDNNREAFNLIKRRKEQKRKAKKRMLDNNFTPLQWEQCLEAFKNCCAYCGNEGLMEQEHFVSIQNSGEYTANNIIPACRSCNAKKSDKNFFEWYPKSEFYSVDREKKILKYLNYKNNIQQLSIL